MTLFSRLTDKSAQLQGTDYLLADVGTPPVTSRVTAASVAALGGGGGGGGSGDMLSLRLDSVSAANMSSTPVETWSASQIQTSTHSSWDSGNSVLTLSTPGTYKITVNVFMRSDDNSDFGSLVVFYGTKINGNGALFPYQSKYFMTNTPNDAGPNTHVRDAAWSDTFQYRTGAGGNETVGIGAFANSYTGSPQLQYILRLAVEYVNNVTE